MLLLAIGCMDYGITWKAERFEDTGGLDHYTEFSDSEDAEEEEESSGGGNGGGSGGNGGGSDDDDDDHGGDDEDETEEPGSSQSSARAPKHGELVISELMIDPSAVPDAEGEWVELWNRGDAWVDLDGHILADDDVDGVEMTGDLVVAPGGFLVVCANDSRWDNGGVTCDGAYVYETWGDGFALSNPEDEVILKQPDGTTLDRFEWSDEDWAQAGESMGVDPDEATVGLNDDIEHWCAQWGVLSSGDSGNPGEENDWCW